MISLDTNVLVRVLVDDPQMPQQTEQARLRVSQLRQVYVTQIVQVETACKVILWHSFYNEEA